MTIQQSTKCENSGTMQQKANGQKTNGISTESEEHMPSRHSNIRHVQKEQRADALLPVGTKNK